MAEFGVVMHDWSRMCKHFWTGDPLEECSEDCPLKEIWCPYMDEPVMDAGKFDAEKLESVVTEWAAEHPEPVYPTWIDVMKMYGVTDETGYCYLDSAYKPIPADIAQKLGIEPKEG